MTWLSFCARRSGPEWKTGYGTGDRTLAQIEGVVDHSQEGTQAGAYSVLDGPRQSSWTFSLPKVGEPVQHYSLEKITWHAGLPGDRRQDTSLIGNLTLVGKEHEGVAGEPWTENQLFWSTKIDVAVRALCPAFGANPPTLRLNQWEHNWLSATSCPSGRNPWVEKFIRINELEDDDMPSQKEWDAMKAWQRAISPTLRDELTTSAFLIQGRAHRLVNPDVAVVLGYENVAYLPVTHEYILTRAPEDGGPLTLAEAEEIVNPSGGGGYTDDDAIRAVKDAL